MIDLNEWKPNLIPNNPKDGSFDLAAVIEKNGGIKNYRVTLKKDGVRLQMGVSDRAMSRSMKSPKSFDLLSRFQPLNDFCIENKITLDGEFYSHSMKFNEIYRFYAKIDVGSESYRKKLNKELLKDPMQFVEDYGGRDIDFLTTFHPNLNFWLFDGIVLDRPDLIGYEERMNEILTRLNKYTGQHLVNPSYIELGSIQDLYKAFDRALIRDFEGLVLTHKDNPYLFKRAKLKDGTLLKMKDDAKEYDGIIVDILEGTQVKKGVERGVDEFGNSTTSGKKEDREPNGKAKDFVIKYENKGTFSVGLRTFNDEKKKYMLEHKEEFIGRHFVYTAMKPLKNYPRHAYFKHWRDEK